MDRNQRNADHIGNDIGDSFDQAKGWMKEKWGWLTDDDYTEMEGRKEKIQAKVRDHYGDDRWEDEYRKFSDEYPQYR